jgi:hypothetical protein
MSDYLNLNEAGALTQSGKNYAGNAEENLSGAKNQLSKMEGVETGFRGAAGSTFQGNSAVSATNHAAIAKQIADQAMRAVLGEKAALQSDEDAMQTQQATRSAAEGLTPMLNRSITA